MRFGINFANFGYLGNVETVADLAVDAEAAGWDAVFLWDHVNWTDMGFHADPWIALGIIASRTQRVQIGTGVTPIARRRPTKLAREILTLDQVSGGRFVFGAGNGVWPSEFEDLGDPAELATRAARLDEGLELLQALWSGAPVDHQGAHYRAKAQPFAAEATHIPIWLAATWPNRKPFRRAARYEGVMAIREDFVTALTPDEVREIDAYVAAHRDSQDPFELCVGLNTGDDPAADSDRAATYAEAGATLWMDGVFPPAEPFEAARARIRRGPPRF